MGFRLAGHILETVTDVTPTQKLILIGLAERADAWGREAFPSNATLARYAVCTGRSVELALKELRQDPGHGVGPWISVQRPATNRRPTTYAININRLMDYRGEEHSPQTKNTTDSLRKTAEKAGRGEEPSPLDARGEESSPQTSAPGPRGEENSTAGAKISAVRGEESSPDPILRTDPGTHPKDTDTADADASVFVLTEAGDQGDSVLRARFERLWGIYPRGAKKQRAWSAFERLAPNDGLVDVMVAKVQLQKRTVWGGIEPRFIPHLASWLRDQQWLDGEDISPVSDKELGEAYAWRERIHIGRCPHVVVHTAADDVECLKEIALRQRQQTDHRRSA